jgi:hypothetical protein
VTTIGHDVQRFVRRAARAAYAEVTNGLRGEAMNHRTAIQTAAAVAALFIALTAAPMSADAHGGGLNAAGCHNDRKNGGYHCHRAPASRAAPASNLNSTGRSNLRSGETYYANCSEARAAGAAPVRRGDPGYAPHLDRDSDGVGCE